MLTNTQKTHLVLLAKEAYEHAQAKDPWFSTVLNPFDEWRHGECAKACGAAGLRCADERDFEAIRGHFLKLAGKDDQALKEFVAAQNAGVRRAWAVLMGALNTYGYRREYVAKICKDKYKCDLDRASEGQLWKLLYDVRRNGRAKLKDQNKEAA